MLMGRLLSAPWYACLLFAAAGIVWCIAMGTKPAVRGVLRMACALYASLAVSVVFALAVEAVVPISTTLAAAFLALAAYGSFRRPVGGGVVWGLLGGALLSGIVSAVFGELLLVVLSQAVSLLTMLSICRRGLMRLWAPSIQLALGSLALAGACCTMILPNRGGIEGGCLFCTAGLLGVSLAVARISDTLVKVRRT